MQFDLLGGSYASEYVSLNTQKTINWYPVLSSQQEQNKSQIAIFPTPGQLTYTTLSGRYGRALFTVRTQDFTRCFAIVDQTLYEIATNFTFVSRGTLTNIPVGSSRLIIECNLQNEVFIGGYDASYVYDMDTETLTQITDSAFPNHVSSAIALDNYTVVASDGAVYVSLTTSALNWTGGETYSTTYKAAPVIALATLREQIFNFTTESIEVFINDGESPYARLPRTSISRGLLAKNSLATFVNGFVFLSKSREGEAQVVFYDGWNTPEPLPDTSINTQINKATTLEDAYGYIQQTKSGKYWYYLTIPDLRKTFVYDFSTGMWHTRHSTAPWVNADGTVDQIEFRGAFHTNFNGKNLYLDAHSPVISYEDADTFAELGQMIKRERISQTITQEDAPISHAQFVLDCNVGQALSSGQGSNPMIMMSWSDNGGHNYKQESFVGLGSQGDYDHRVRLNKLGTSRKRNYKFVLTDPVNLMIQNAYINGVVNGVNNG